jgi:tetratricopeptide (TPR) repeat protein
MSALAAERPRGIPPGFLDQLRAHLANRRIQAGFDWLDSHRWIFDQVGPGLSGSAAAAGYLAQWVDAGYGSTGLIKQLLARFPERGRAHLSVEDYAHLRMAEGILLLSSEDLDRAMDVFDVILAVAPHLEDQELAVVAHFGRARCQRRKGEYGKAYSDTIAARDLAQSLGFQGMAAVIRTLESWLVFRRGKLREAAVILEGAESTLKHTDDFITLGNIQSAFGRLAQHEGRYEQALHRFTASLDHYVKRHPDHQNLARSLANMAYVERLLSLRIKKKIDADVAHRRKGGVPSTIQAPLRERFDQIRTDAMAHLRQAGEIYEKRLQHHGAGTVKVNCGFLHFDAGEFDAASAEAAEAFQLGKDKNDFILMARARLLQCSVENARLEEGIEGEEPGQHARAALDYARDAIEYATNTEHTRLLARAHLAEGFNYCNDFFNDTNAARISCDAAAALLKTEGFDPLWEDVRTLRAKITRATGVDATLRAWSQGDVGEKTFQQLTEEFAELIIPKIWEQENRKISRVATRLSVSPKKVRRILGRAGLLRRETLSI